MNTAHRRRRNRWSAIVLAVFALIGLAAVVAPAGAGAQPRITVPPHPSRDSPGLVSSAPFQKAPGEYFFRSPSGNIYCAIRNPAGKRGDDLLAFGCQTVRSVKPANGPACRNTANNTYRVSILPGGRLIHGCTSQGIYTAPQPRTLQYGQTVWIYGNWCTSTRDGMACWAGSRPGFLISRDVNRTIA